MTLLAFCLLALPLAAGPASGETLDQYQARLARWSGTVAKARGELGRGDPGWRVTMKALAGEASRPVAVARPEGVRVGADHGWLTSHLGRALAAPSRRSAKAALEVTAAEVAAYRAALAPAPRVDRARLRAVLARAVPAAGAGRRLPLQWLGKLLGRLMSWLEKLLSRLPRRWGSAPRLLFWVIVGLAGAVLAAALGLAIRAIFGRFSRGARAPRPSVEVGRPWAPPDADAVLDRARQAAAAGSYREAIRHLYLALLLKLDLAGLLSYQPSRTNWEYLRALRASGRLPTGEVTSLTGIFDRKWYGGESAAASDYRHCEQLFGRVLSQASAAAGAA